MRPILIYNQITILRQQHAVKNFFQQILLPNIYASCIQLTIMSKKLKTNKIIMSNH